MTEQMPEIPIPAEMEPPKPDLDQEAAMRAAVFYRRAKDERDEFIKLLEQSKVALEVRDNQLEMLKLELATERNRYDVLHHEYSEVQRDRADLEALLANLQTDLENQAAKLGRFEFTRLRTRRRNGKPKQPSEPVPDSVGSEIEVAIGETVVAHVQPLLGRPKKGGE